MDDPGLDPGRAHVTIGFYRDSRGHVYGYGRKCH